MDSVTGETFETNERIALEVMGFARMIREYIETFKEQVGRSMDWSKCTIPFLVLVKTQDDYTSKCTDATMKYCVNFHVPFLLRIGVTSYAVLLRETGRALATSNFKMRKGAFEGGSLTLCDIEPFEDDPTKFSVSCCIRFRGALADEDCVLPF